MSQTTYLQITFQHFWHVSAAIHRHKLQEALKDSRGFPYISDQQIHGILKDICQQAEGFKRIAEDTTSNLLGGNDAPKWLQVGTAQLSEETKAAIESNTSMTKLYTVLPSNSLDDEGNTKKGHFRSIETVIPVNLYASVNKNTDARCSDEDYEKALCELEIALKGRHRIASDKNSGFGRCTLTLSGNRVTEQA